MILILKKCIEMGNVENKKQSINQSDKHSLYQWAAWEEIIMGIYNEELRKMEEKKKTWYSWDQSIYLNASNRSVKSK